MRFQTKDYYGEIFPDQYRGWFEHEVHGDGQGGGLWFEGNTLIDYDGMACLPKQVIEALRELGFIVGEEFE